MVRCPNCMHEVAQKNFCEVCGGPLSYYHFPPTAGNAYIQEQPGFIPQKECPYCKKTFHPDANYCQDCVVDGKSVVLLQKENWYRLKFRAEGDTTGNTLDFAFYDSIEFGRREFKKWYRIDNVIKKEEWSHISRQHFKIEKKPDRSLQITDMNSANGTHLNGTELEPGVPTAIGSGAEIGLPLGNKIFKFKVEIIPPTTIGQAGEKTPQ